MAKQLWFGFFFVELAHTFMAKNYAKTSACNRHDNFSAGFAVLRKKNWRKHILRHNGCRIWAWQVFTLCHSRECRLSILLLFVLVAANGMLVFRVLFFYVFFDILPIVYPPLNTSSRLKGTQIYRKLHALRVHVHTHILVWPQMERSAVCAHSLSNATVGTIFSLFLLALDSANCPFWKRRKGEFWNFDFWACQNLVRRLCNFIFSFFCFASARGHCLSANKQFVVVWHEKQFWN